MRAIQQAEPFSPRRYDVFAGLDVDKTSISVTFMDHGNSVKSFRIPNKAENLLNYVSKNFPEKQVAFAYEAGPTGYGLYDSITAAGYPCLVVAPAMVPTAPGMRVKTNKIDSKKISESLRGGQLKSIHVPSAAYRQLRHLVQHRDTCVRNSIATKLRIKALLLFEGIPYPKAENSDEQWSRDVISKLKALECSSAVRFKLDQLLAALEFSRNQVLVTTKEIRRFCTEEADILNCIMLLISIPGIGWITATHLLARIGDWRNLGNVRQLAAFLGLAQRENSTGEHVNRGGITRSGDGRLRNKLVQGAWAAIRIDPELREFYRRIYQRHPKNQAPKKAIVAVARKMTMRIHAVLSQQREYVVRPHIPSVPLHPEEMICPRERLDSAQKQEMPDAPDVS
ncbi:MAG: IS110 family transposase [Elusimicrobiota bacterium]|jgi:transposase